MVILDIGCGMGNYTSSISKRYKDARIMGMDISANAIGYAAKEYSDIDFLVGSLPCLPAKYGSLDLILCLETLYYLSANDRKAALARIRESLAEGGRLVVSGGLDDGKKYFNEKQLITMMSGFEVQSVTYNYALLYARFEKYTLQALDLFELIRTDRIPSAKEGEGRTKRGIATKIGLALASRIARNKKLANGLSDLMSNAIVRILSWDAPVKFGYGWTRRFSGEKGKTHIIVIAKNAKE
jgi:SAM-dependent methyltransferase